MNVEQTMNESAEIVNSFLVARFVNILVLGYFSVMAKASASKSKWRAVTRGSGNVFADLNFSDAEERQTKLRLAYALNTIMQAQRLTQAAAAARLGLNQPKVSALRNYRLEGFSVERLMTLLNALDQDIEIVIRKKPRARAAKISVVAA